MVAPMDMNLVATGHGLSCDAVVRPYRHVVADLDDLVLLKANGIPLNDLLRSPLLYRSSLLEGGQEGGRGRVFQLRVENILALEERSGGGSVVAGGLAVL